MQNAGLWVFADRDKLGAPVDYHEVRGHLRIGTVQIHDEELRTRLVEGRDVSPPRRRLDLPNGQELTGFSLSPARVRCAFEFDLGATLRTTPYDKDSEQWSLYTPGHRVLCLRADRHYTYMRSDVPTDEAVWKSVIK